MFSFGNNQYGLKRCEPCRGRGSGLIEGKHREDSVCSTQNNVENPGTIYLEILPGGHGRKNANSCINKGYMQDYPDFLLNAGQLDIK